MKVGEIIEDAQPPARGVEISQLAYDNRRVQPGALFFCVPGFTRDGHDFAAGAKTSGAAALVVDHALPDVDLPQVLVRDVRSAMARAAANFYGHPTRQLEVSGVTGTNGKTTTAYLLRELLEAAGRQTGMLGTVKSIIGGTEHEVTRTTPEAIDMQASFAEMLAGGDRAAVIEVSSHALELSRADAIHFRAAIFTNLSQDHLDFHPTMEDYFNAKRRLFADLRPEASVVNSDDSYGARLAREFPVITFGLDDPNATFRATDLETGLFGSRFTLRSPTGTHRLTSPLRGRFNVYNVLGALAAAVATGVPFETAAKAIESAGQVPGRFETVDEGQKFAVLVDYAHTPDSLENVLEAARALIEPGSKARLHVVFGCGGDRDRGKRPLMGEIASRLADRVIVTSDNPRSEEPEAIITDILRGVHGKVESETDRAKAIADAVSSAAAGDIVVIAGKGHEQ
ncbi:MAG: UDP-N-acetylmuramoyl-L-alanyl-D-glutamate--2,6-diaminopimelate ligase, partial [Solirubrobacterales bacterium]|nr:UDP-N-acetylmuramoyl-L-alanyl-D-glutamate--2,6-diaminopimelate ligase [Solirubrobacterales bacterium]